MNNINHNINPENIEFLHKKTEEIIHTYKNSLENEKFLTKKYLSPLKLFYQNLLEKEKSLLNFFKNEMEKCKIKSYEYFNENKRKKKYNKKKL